MRLRLAVPLAGALALLAAPTGAPSPAPGAATISTIGVVPHPRGVALLGDGDLLVAAPFAHLVQRVDPAGGAATVAGTGVPGFAGDGGPAVAASLNLVHGVSVLPDGGYLLADTLNNRIRRVAPDGTIATVAGTGVAAYGGDGGPATAAAIAAPRGVAALPDGGFLIPDTDNHRVRRVFPDGRIETVAGTGAAGYGGDGGPATAALLHRPFEVAPLPDGGFLVADAGNERIRHVGPNRTIATVAGTGAQGFSGDGGPATAAALDRPHDVVALPGGGFLVADTFNNRVRRVGRDGRIATVAGSGEAAFSGDGGAATLAALNQPKAVVPQADGGFLVADSANDRIRYVTPPPPLTLSILRTRLLARPPGVRVDYRVSARAALRLDVFARGARVAGAAAAARAGKGSIRALRFLGAGRYVVRLSATDAEGRRAVTRAALVVRR